MRIRISDALMHKFSPKVLMAFIIGAISYPTGVFGMFSAGLDPSWAYALNRMAAAGGTFDPNHFFTYGPLGFLTCVRKVGNNLYVALSFWLVVTAVFFGCLCYLFFCTDILKDKRRAIIAFCLYLVSSAFSKGDNWFCFVAMLCLLLAWKYERRFMFVFDVFLMLSIFMKFTMFLQLISAVCVLCAVQFFGRKKGRMFFLAHLLAALAGIPVLYLLCFNHSPVAFCKYLRGSIEIASGYNTAMSTSYFNVFVIFVVIAVVMYLCCLCIAWKEERDNFCLLLILAGHLFLFYKHGFVRCDGHVWNAFNGLLTVSALLVLFYFGKFSRAFLCCFVLFVLPSFVSRGNELTGIVQVVKTKTFEFPDRLNKIRKQKPSGMEPLPPAIIETIGSASVAIYPWEVFYAASNDLNYRQMPAIQNYSNYTPWLDKKTAEFFSAEDAPEYIILDNYTIDDRWPFIEAPQTWRSIRANYQVVLYSEGHLLLKKASARRDEALSPVSQWAQEKNAPISVQKDAPFLKVDASLSFFGRVAKFLWKIPEVNMTVTYEDGWTETHRILLDLLSAGFDAGAFASFDVDSVIDCINYSGEFSRIKEISFSGKGLRFYKNTISVSSCAVEKQLWNIPVSNYAFYAERTELPPYKIIEKDFPHNIDREYISDTVSFVRGWAFYEDAECDVYICNKSTKEFFMAKKVERPDVKDVFPVADMRSGFEARINAGKGYSLYLINHGTHEIYTSSRKQEQNQ